MANDTTTVTPGVGKTINLLAPNQSTQSNSPTVGIAIDQVLLAQLQAGSNAYGAAYIADGQTPANRATVAQFHNSDNQSLPGTAYGLNTGGVAQLLNAVGNIDRQRETGQNNVPSAGIASGSQQLKSPISTTLAAMVSAGTTTATLAATKFTNNGQAAWIQVGSILLLEFGTSNQEAVLVSGVNYGTNVVTIYGLGSGHGFQFGHTTSSSVISGAYNEAVDATSPEGSSGAGLSLSATALFNSSLNNGNGGWEYNRSANGELDGAVGKGTAVAAEYEFNGGGPVLASGIATGFAFDRARSLQAKGLGSGTITSSVAGNTSIVFSSAANTNLIQPGQKIRLRGGSVKETVIAIPSWGPGSSATVPIQSPVVNNGQTTAEWDIYGVSGPGLNGFLADGIGIEEEALYDPVSDLFYIERAATADGMAQQNIVAENPALWNGSSMDRHKSAPGATGVAAVSSDGTKATYRYAVVAFAPFLTSTTDFIVIQGSGTKTCRIKSIRLSGVSGTAGNVPIQLVRRSTAGTLGSAVLTAVSAGKHDTSDPAATATVSTVGTANYTTLGTTANNIGAARLILPLAANAGGNGQAIIWDFSTRQDKAVILRGTSDFLCLNANGTTLAASTLLDFEIEMEEDNS